MCFSLLRLLMSGVPHVPRSVSKFRRSVRQLEESMTLHCFSLAHLGKAKRYRRQRRPQQHRADFGLLEEGLENPDTHKAGDARSQSNTPKKLRPNPCDKIKAYNGASGVQSLDAIASVGMPAPTAATHKRSLTCVNSHAVKHALNTYCMHTYCHHLL